MGIFGLERAVSEHATRRDVAISPLLGRGRGRLHKRLRQQPHSRAPAPGYTHLATNSAGVANPEGLIDCEIHVARDIPDTPVEGQLFDPCVGKNVTITGVHVEDRSHENKTEIHPIDSMVADLGADGAGHHFRF
jgi:hypothetical protein